VGGGRCASAARGAHQGHCDGGGDPQQPVVGYGIVVGLHGTGDSQQTGFPCRRCFDAAAHGGERAGDRIRVQNLRRCFVSATLPPFARPGAQIDSTISSAGDATSLEAGCC